MNTLDLVIHRTAHKTQDSAKKYAKALGMGHQVFLNKVNPNCESNILSIHQALALMIAAGDPAIYHALGDDLEQAGVLNQTEEKPLLQAVLQATAELGDIDRTINQALEDHHLSDREKLNILQEIEEAQQALANLKAAVFKMKTGAL